MKSVKYKIKKLKNNLMRKDLLLRAKSGKRPSPAASITVEASLVLPIFIFFFVNILGAFDILKLQCDMTSALHQTGIQLMESAAITGLTGETDDGISSALLKTGAAVYADRKLKNYFKDNNLKHSCVVGGDKNISLAESALYSGNDIVDLVASCKVHPTFKIAAFTDFGVESRFYGHAFTGYDVRRGSDDITEDSEELVYITEQGSVYHRSLSCSHLKIKITAVKKNKVQDLRNSDRAKYYPCELCGSGRGTTVYITNYGNRYHTNQGCSGLKRSIRTVPISEAAGRRPCSECG